jgi:ribosome-binding factor A
VSRQRKIEAQLQRVLADVISREVNDPRVGNITITSVSVSPDMKNARIYFVPFAASKNPLKQVQEGLSRAGGFLRGEVARRLGLRYMPRLQFVFDESIDRAARLTELIEKAVK